MGRMSNSSWIEELDDQIVALDTAPLIYYVEEHPLNLPSLERFFRAIDEGYIQVVTSTVTLLEVLIQPLRQGNARVIERYRNILLDADGLDTIPVSAAVAEEAAQLRAIYRLTPPDAFQLATAVVEKANTVLTNDLRFPCLSSPRILILDEVLGV